MGDQNQGTDPPSASFTGVPAPPPGTKVVFCQRCQQLTLHTIEADGGLSCQRCATIAQAASQQVAAKAKKPGLPPFAKLCVLAVVLTVPLGFVHCVYGPAGPTVCAKESWGLSDTFVDSDDYIGKPVISLLPKANVVRALVRCNVLELPEGLRNRD